MRHRAPVEGDVGAESREQLARARPGDGESRPLRRHGRDEDLEVRPFALAPFLEPARDAAGAAAGRRDHEVLAAEARDGAVVDDDAVLVEHQAVADPAVLELRHVVDVEAVEELRGVRAGDLDLAERGGVEDADARAHGRGLALHGLRGGLALAQVAGGAHPAAGFPPVRAERLVFRVRREQSLRRIARAELPSGERAERDRRVRRTKGRGADFGRAPCRHLGDGQERVEVRGLALVDRHAAGRVALQVLDVLVALRERDLGVGHGDVVQQVEPLAAALVLRARRHAGLGRERRLLHGRPRDHEFVRASRVGEHLVDRVDRFGEARIERGAAVQRADRLQRRPRFLRAEAAPALLEGDRCARVGPQVQGGLPAAGNAERVAVDGLAGVEHDALEALAPERLDDAAAGADFDALGAQPLGEVGGRLAAAVEHELDRRAGGHEVEGGEVGGIVVGRKDDLLPGRNAVAVGVLAHGAGEQDARQVVLCEHERLLDRTRREQRLLRIHAPVALAHGGGLAAEVEPLQEARHAVVIKAEAGGSRSAASRCVMPRARRAGSRTTR